MKESQLIISAIKHEIINNEKQEGDSGYYDIVENSYSDEVIDKYMVRLQDANDQIYLAQWCNGNKHGIFKK